MSDTDRWAVLRESIKLMLRNSNRWAISERADFHQIQAEAFRLVLDEMTTIEQSDG